MTMKRNAECSLSERAIAFSVDALLSGTGKSKTPRTDQEDEPHAEARDFRDEIQSEYHIKSDYACSFEEEKKNTIQVELQGAELWSQFYKLGNEMIITKSGRRIFPALKVKVKGLEPKSHYIMWADIVPVDNLRYRYVYHTSQWVVAGAGEEPAVRPSIYLHPDSPSLGRQWQSQVVTFDKLKLTNNKNSVSKGQVILHSMHKYLPRIHVQKTSLPDCDSEDQIDVSESVTFTFPETEFITVTAYQNQQITRLKIASNPFAKGFREVLRTGRKGSTSAGDRQKLEAVNNFAGTNIDSCLSNFPSARGIPFSENMDIPLHHQSAFFPPSSSLYHLGTMPLHYSSQDNLRTTHSYLPFSPYYDVRLISHAASTVDGYHRSGEPLLPNLGQFPFQDNYFLRSDSQSGNATGLVLAWKPGREESKPTARVAPCIMHESHPQVYTHMPPTVPHQKDS